jgi:hypothetical protein
MQRYFDFEKFLDAVFERLGNAPDAGDVAAETSCEPPPLTSPACGAGEG